MKKTVVIAGLIAFLIGLFLWFIFPELQMRIALMFGAIIAYFIVSGWIEDTVTRLLWSEFKDLRQESRETLRRLDDIDRKFSALERHLTRRF